MEEPELQSFNLCMCICYKLCMYTHIYIPFKRILHKNIVWTAIIVKTQIARELCKTI